MTDRTQSNRDKYPWIAKIMDGLRAPDLKYPDMPSFNAKVIKITEHDNAQAQTVKTKT